MAFIRLDIGKSEMTEETMELGLMAQGAIVEINGIRQDNAAQIMISSGMKILKSAIAEHPEDCKEGCPFYLFAHNMIRAFDEVQVKTALEIQRTGSLNQD